MSYLIQKDDFGRQVLHVIIEQWGKQATACGRKVAKNREVLTQPPENMPLCRDCYYACTPGKRKAEATASEKARSKLNTDFKVRRTKSPKTLKPLAGQLGLPSAEGVDKIFDGRVWVKRD